MPDNKKFKAIGKCAIVILCCSIVFFLLLPFMESPLEKATTAPKKASPQIFTSNPLTDLVRKVYSFFKHNEKNKPQVPHIYDYLQETLVAQNPEQTSSRAASENDKDETTSVSSVGVVYNQYGEAGIINEDGEWILVRQTIPEAAQRGLHEVNISDSAYDKLIRMERVSKVIGQPALSVPEIPDSKWARLWQPIKNFFSLDKDDKGEQTSSDEEPFFQLASAKANSASSANIAGMGRVSYPMDLPSSLPSQKEVDGDMDDLLKTFFNTEETLEEIINSFNEMSDGVLSSKERQQVQNDIRKRGKQIINRHKKKILDDINKAAQNQDLEDLAVKTIGCDGDSFKSFYTTSDEICATNLRDDDNNSVLVRQQMAAEDLSKHFGLPPEEIKKISVLVVLGKDLKSHLPQDQKTEDSSGDQKPQLDPQLELKQTLDALLKQKDCSKQTCYWVGGEIQENAPLLRWSIQSAGVEFEGASLSNGQDENDNSSTTDQIQQPQDGQDKDNQIQQTKIPHYIPVTEQEMDDLLQKTHFVLFANARTAQVVGQEKHIDPLRLLFDREGKILSETDTGLQESGNQARGNSLKKELSQRFDEINQIRKELNRAGSRKSLEAILPKKQEQIRKDLNGLPDKHPPVSH